VVALAAGATIEAAAAAAGLSRRTVQRRLEEPAFRAELQAARERLIEEGIGRLAGLAATAIQTLRDVMTDPEAPHAAKVSAARATLEHLLRAREAVELSGRVAALEELFRTQRPPFPAATPPQ
jgi:hypothetical protein